MKRDRYKSKVRIETEKRRGKRGTPRSWAFRYVHIDETYCGSRAVGDPAALARKLAFLLTGKRASLIRTVTKRSSVMALARYVVVVAFRRTRRSGRPRSKAESTKCGRSAVLLLSDNFIFTAGCFLYTVYDFCCENCQNKNVNSKIVGKK